jgi:hypothetical protein
MENISAFLEADLFQPENPEFGRDGVRDVPSVPQSGNPPLQIGLDDGKSKKPARLQGVKNVPAYRELVFVAHFMKEQVGKNGVKAFGLDIFFGPAVRCLEPNSELLHAGSEKPKGVRGIIHDGQAGQHAILEYPNGQVSGVDADLKKMGFRPFFERQTGQKTVKEIHKAGSDKRRDRLMR